MNFSGKMCLKIILKVIKNQGFTLSVDDAFFKKPQDGSEDQFELPPPPPPYPTSRFTVTFLKKKSTPMRGKFKPSFPNT